MLQDVTYATLSSCRFEFYLRAKQTTNDILKAVANKKNGLTAVVRNMWCILTAAPRIWRVIVVDRFYTSMSLLLQPLMMQLYAVGTVRTNLIGYCKSVIDTQKKRPGAARKVQEGSVCGRNEHDSDELDGHKARSFTQHSGVRPCSDRIPTQRGGKHCGNG